MELFAAFPAAMSLPDIIAESGAVGISILLITFALSVMTWAVVWDRARLYKKLRRRGDALRRVAGTRGVATVMPEAEKYLPAIEAAILMEANRFVQTNGGENGVIALDDPAELDQERNRLRNLLEGRALNEIGEMERHLILLSTTSAGAPFLGLFGTVWGIMHSFMSMGMEGSASIEVVGGGIAEALVTTMAGLGCAIPALVAYNLCVRAVRRKETQVDLFISRVLDGVLVRRGAQRNTGAACARRRDGLADDDAMKRGSPYSSMADINVTSLVDIMMVLLIIFMLTSQYIQSGIQVKLPKADSKVIKETDAITISVNKKREIYINNDKVKVDRVKPALKTLKATGETRVYVRADEAVPYGVVMEVVGEVMGAGITDVGMITDKKNAEREEQNVRRAFIGSFIFHVLVAIGIVQWVAFSQLDYVKSEVYSVQLVGGITTASASPAKPAPPKPAPVEEKKVEEKEDQMPAPPTETKKPKPAEKKKSEVPTTDPSRIQKPDSSLAGDAGNAGDAIDGPPGDVPAMGSVSFDGGDFPFASYVNRMRQKIATAWEVPVGTEGLERSAVIYFRVTRDGSVSNVVVETTSGLPLFDRSCQRAVMEAAPLPPLPREYRDDYIGVHFSFLFQPTQ